MLSSLTGMFSKLKENKIVQNITDNYNRLKQQARPKMEFLEIAPNLYHISYPQEPILKQLKEHIGDRDFQIWNISQYKYDQKLEKLILQNSENGQIHHLCFQYYSNLPLYQLIIAINSIHHFLAISNHHRVYIHCQDNKIRSSVFLVCFIYKFKLLNLNDVSDAIFYINEKLHVNIEMGQTQSDTANYNNLHTFFKNYINYVNTPQMINKHKLELLKIIVSDAPKIKLPNEIVGKGENIKELKVLIEIRCKEEIIMKATFDNKVFEGQSLCLQLSHRTIILGDDFLVLLKYIYQGKIYSMMRIQLNTNFIFEKFFRAHQQFIDLSSYCFMKKETPMFIDFMFEENHELSDLAKLQLIPAHQALKVHKKHKKLEKVEEKAEEKQKSQEKKAEEANLNFVLQEQEEDEHQVDEHEINRKIQEVLKNINAKKTEEEEGEENQEDFDDYLTKLESQI